MGNPPGGKPPGGSENGDDARDGCDGTDAADGTCPPAIGPCLFQTESPARSTERPGRVSWPCCHGWSGRRDPRPDLGHQVAHASLEIGHRPPVVDIVAALGRLLQSRRDAGGTISAHIQA